MQKTDRYDLTSGGILQKMVTLAVPIMGTQLLQMAYNLTDMFWLGRLGSEAVAAAGTVGQILWLSQALYNYGNKGAEIGVSQNLGRGEPAAARGYAQSSVSLAIALGVAFAAFAFFLRGPIIGFYNIREAGVVTDAKNYLAIVAVAFPFTYVTGAAVGAFNGSGNSATPFFVNGAGLVLNMVLDPLLIFTFGMGVIGAAIATATAQIVVCIMMMLALKHYRHRAFECFKLFALPKRAHLRHIFRWATPIVVESFFFTFLSMILSRFIASFGAGAIAAQRIGSQVESLSWLIAGGFSSAFTAYVGQNYGAGKWSRIHKGFRLSTIAMGSWGVVVTAVIFFGARPIFSVFLPGEPDVIVIGTEYLRILASCQLLGCLEPIASGAWRGMGKTVPPSVISIVVNMARVVLSWFLAFRTPMGLSGIFWGLCLGAAARSLFTYVGYVLSARKMPRADAAPQAET